MNRISLKRTIKKCTIYYSYLGVGIGIIMLFIMLVNPTIPFHVGDKDFYGFTAGILELVSFPLIMGIVGFTHSFIIWYPLMALFRFIKKQFK